MSLQEVENAISAMNQAAFQELGDLLEDRHSGHRINPHGSPDCPRNYELHGPRPTRHLNRWLVNLSASAISTQEVADLFVTLTSSKWLTLGIAQASLALFSLNRHLPQCHFATLRICHKSILLLISSLFHNYY